jgi:hypothetical protein
MYSGRSPGGVHIVKKVLAGGGGGGGGAIFFAPPLSTRNLEIFGSGLLNLFI